MKKKGVQNLFKKQTTQKRVISPNIKITPEVKAAMFGLRL